MEREDEPLREENMLIIDRIEGDIAVCESDSDTLNIPLSQIKGTPKSGDVLKRKGEIYIIDESSTAGRQRRMTELQNDIFTN